MPRMARLVVPDYPHHVTQRGSRRQKTFFCDDDYRYYIRLLAEFSSKAGTQIWAYCLMPNHVHLVLVPSVEDGLRATLGETHRRYTRCINEREDWRGHLWQERFHSFVMDEGYLLATVRYVERNPVTAGLCSHPEQWPWSSANAHLSGEDDDLVKVRPMLERVDDWQAYLADDHCQPDQYEAIQHANRTGRPLGNERFIAHLEHVSGRILRLRKPGRKPQT